MRSESRAGYIPIGAWVVAIGMSAVPALAAAGQHTTLASFQAATRANTLLEPFNGTLGQNLPSVPLSGGGFAGNVSAPSAGLISSIFGIGSVNSGEIMRLTFTGRPVSAFAATLTVIDAAFESVAGNVRIETSTGETFVVSVPVGGTFFGFTASSPFTSMTINAPPGIATEFIDDAHVGIAANVAELTDQCADAETINPINAFQYPYSTVNTGATATTISGSCATIDSGPDVWVRFVSPVYGNVTVNTCGANFDTVLRVFTNCGPAGNGVGATQIVCNDDFCAGGATAGGNLASQVQFRAEAGEDYLIRVSGFNGQVGSGTLTFSVVPDCQADFNHTGGPQTLQDIFDFLAAWFGGC